MDKGYNRIMMDKSDDPTYSACKLNLTSYSEHAIGSINYDKPHRVRLTMVRVVAGIFSLVIGIPIHIEA